MVRPSSRARVSARAKRSREVVPAKWTSAPSLLAPVNGHKGEALSARSLRVVAGPEFKQGALGVVEPDGRPAGERVPGGERPAVGVDVEGAVELVALELDRVRVFGARLDLADAREPLGERRPIRGRGLDVAAQPPARNRAAARSEQQRRDGDEPCGPPA